MEINFQHLDDIPNIYKLLKILNEKIENKIEKRWLSTNETATYLGYSKDSIDSLVKKGEFIINIHYFQKERKRMFDKEALDKWVIGINISANNISHKINSAVEDIISSIAV